MVTLLLLKRYELNTGRIFLGSARPAIGAFFHRKLTWFEYVLPGLMRVGAKRFLRTLQGLLQVWFARVVVRVEHFLEQALQSVKHTTTQAPRGHGSSAFLREVAEHKKK